jgi:hypothetical protein
MTNIDQEMSGSPVEPIRRQQNVMILTPVNAEEVGKRGPGRPRTKVNPTDVKVTPSSVYPPPQTSAAAKAAQVAEDEQEKKRLAKLARKRAETTDLKNQIVGEFNDQIIEALISVGFPSEYLYKPGYVPKSSIVNSNYSELGNALCINPSQAQWMARGWVEAKEIPQVKKLIGEGGKTDGPAYLWVALGGLGLFSYVSQLTKAMKMIGEIRDHMSRIAQAAVENVEQESATAPSFSEAD